LKGQPTCLKNRTSQYRYHRCEYQVTATGKVAEPLNAGD